WEVLGRDTKDKRAVSVEVAGNRLKVDPPPHQWKRDRRREHATPHDQPMGQATQPPALEDVGIRRKIHERAATQAQRVATHRSTGEERLPAATPVHPRGWTVQPHRVAVTDAERGEG